MDRLGFIHEKLDIKILILFILRRLPGTVNRDMLSDFTQCDGGVGYFDFSDCLSELVDTGLVTESPRREQSAVFRAQKGRKAHCARSRAASQVIHAHCRA